MMSSLKGLYKYRTSIDQNEIYVSAFIVDQYKVLLNSAK
jgi:hypothetical protein